MVLTDMEGIRHIHCLGIGGVGMNAIAAIIHKQGYYVTGSDIISNPATAQLTQLGIPIIFHHQDDSLVAQADLVIYSSAIPSNNLEWQVARAHKIPCLSRGQMLGLLMQGYLGIAVAGTHGKTSTVGLISQLLRYHNLDPTITIGGYLKQIQGHSVYGCSQYFITEADESDGSLMFLQPEIAIITNIDTDHLGYYGYDFNCLVDIYRQFINASKNFVVLCQDDPILDQFIQQGLSSSIVSYGFHASAMIQGRQLRQVGTQLNLYISREKYNQSDLEITAPLLGKHNAYNLLAAVAVATILEIPDTVIQAGLLQYTGVARRVEYLGKALLPVGRVDVIDDYGHHPHEIAATIQAIRAAWPTRRLILVFQPHRYTRTRDLFEEFAKVLAHAPDSVLLLPIYSAHEVPIPGVDHITLVEAIQSKGGQSVLVTAKTLQAILHQYLKKDDILLFQGAGDVTHMARKFKTTWIDCMEYSKNKSH